MIEIERDPFVRQSSEHLRQIGIKAVLFDLDDTCIDTNSLFLSKMRTFSEAVALDLYLDEMQVLQRLHEINTEEHQRPGVEPSRWLTILNRLGTELRNTEAVFKHYPIIQSIYQDEIEIMPGVRSILTSLNHEHFITGQVTHGETDWSVRKNSQSGIINHFDIIVTADVYGSKNETHWLQAMSPFNLLPDQCLIVGDSLHGDILPAVRLGAKSFGLKSPWSIFNQGLYPPEAIILDHISDFWEAVGKLQ